MDAIFNRVSIRKYQDKPVEEKKIELLLRAAMAAPSARNQQPWEYYVVTNKAIIEKLSSASPYTECAKNAPLVFVACYRLDGPSPNYFEIDMSASVENLLLEATGQGLGAVWMGIAPIQERMNYVRDVLQIPEHLNAFALIPCGYPAEERKQQDRFDPARIHFID